MPVARARAQPRVVIDLAECSFLDSSILGVLFSAHAQCERIALVLPASDTIVHRTIGMSGVRDVIPVFETLEEALPQRRDPGSAGIAAVGAADRAGFLTSRLRGDVPAGHDRAPVRGNPR